MEELVNMIATDASAADVSDQIKHILFSKSAKKIDDLRPVASGNLFGFAFLYRWNFSIS